MDISDAEYKCASCRLIFNSLDDQRGHYKTDLHRFNLKRKVAGLPPILQEVFDKKITEIRSKQEDSEREQSQGWFCESCNKSYSSENAHRQHMNSKKHFERVASLSKSNQKPKVINATQLAARQEKESRKGKSRTTEDNEVSTEAGELEDIAESTKPTQDTPMEEERPSESQSEETEAPPKTPEQIMEEKLKLGMALKLKPTDCLFCRKSFDSLEASLEHMTKDHGFFIPDIEYLVDLPGMIAYLGEKVGLGNTCIYCNKSFISAEAVRGHMSSLSHCKLLYDDRGAAELEDFYNFLPSYFEGLDEEAKKELEAEFARQAAAAASGAPTSDEGEIRALEAFAKKHAKAKISEDGFELILEDGRVIGHRALQTYYKQKVKASDNLTESQRIVKNMMSRYQALGWTTKASQHPSGVDPDFLRERRLNSDSQMRLGVKGNKLFMWRRQYGF